MILTKINPVILILFVLLFLAQLYSQNRPGKMKFEHLSPDEGAAINLTYCMIQDHKGFMWFGTMYGLVKYDGREYNIYKNNPDDPNSISFDDIISLYEDSENNIWIGTWGGGLNKLDPETGKFTRFMADTGTKNSISDNIIWTICEDNNGNLWFGTETGGINRYIPGKNLFVKYTNDEKDAGSIPADFIRYIYKDPDGTMWICSHGGLSKYINETDSFITYKTPNGLPAVSAIKAQDGKLWIGTPAGICILDESDNKLIKKNYPELQDKFIYTLCLKENTLWTGTNKGLYKIDTESDEIKEYRNETGNPASLSGNNILNITAGSSGILWINSYGDGINKLKKLPSRFTSYTNLPGADKSLSSNSVTSFCSDNENNIWVGTRNGLNKFDKKEKTFEKFSNNNLRGARITSMLADGNRLWIGTAGGLKLFNIKTQKFRQPDFGTAKNEILNSAYISSLLMDGTNILIGTAGSGLFVYAPNTDSIKHYTSKQFSRNNSRTDYILTLYKDKAAKNIIWIGTFGGLIKMNYGENAFSIYDHRLKDKRSLSNDYIFSILRDSNGNLWAGTANGLNKFDEDSETFDHYYEKDGLPNSVICSITEDKNKNLWISTNDGISEFKIAEDKFRNYNKEDGLLNNFYFNHSSIIDSNGDLYLGGTNGLDIVHTTFSESEKYTPGVYITSFRKTDNNGGTVELPAAKEINLKYDENFINIGFISLDYNNPLRNVYKYRLDGIDKDWINAGNKTSVNYTSLPPGDYAFRVKGSNSSGIFNPNEAVLKFTILPPFWKTSWFNTALILLLIGSAYFIYRLRIKQKIRHILEIEKIKKEESERLRRKTAEDFHDELGHRLTRISLLSEILKRKMGNAPEEIHSILDKISQNSMELYEGTKDFIWAIDPRKDSLYELIIRLKDFGDELFEDSDVFFEVSGLDESLKDKNLTTEWKRHLPLIFKEGMNNALKHGKSRRICINSSIRNDELELTLSDDGRGFVPEISDKGNGLRNMRQRAEKLSAKIKVESSPGNGTKIFFRGKIPEAQMHSN